MAKLYGFTDPKLHRRPQQRRIIIPQSLFRPLKISRRDAVKRDFLSQDDQWFVEHKRGIRRPLVGEDPLEARAVSKDTVPGFLHERIVYQKLLNRRLSPTSDFSFQSSFEGGRATLGGIVVDFLFFTRRLVIRVQGPTHEGNLQRQKDEQQEALLVEMGYTVLDLDLKTIRDDNLLEAWMRRFIDNVWVHGLDYSGYGGNGYVSHMEKLAEHTELIDIALRIETRLMRELV